MIVGRDNNLTPGQRLDFEVIRRHYRNIVDVLTCDDLLRRISRLVELFSRAQTSGS